MKVRTTYYSINSGGLFDGSAKTTNVSDCLILSTFISEKGNFSPAYLPLKFKKVINVKRKSLMKITQQGPTKRFMGILVF